MRISTNTIYNEGINRISDIQSKQVRLQEQLSTGKKFSSPKEDPIAAARALEISHLIADNNSYGAIRDTAEYNLGLVEVNLSGVSDLLISAQSQLVAAGNGALSDLERGFIAKELQSTLDGLVGFANSQDASGKFLYSGFKTDTKPFELNATTNRYEYKGDTGSVKLEVAPNVDMPVNYNGQEVFQTGTDVFEQMQDIITLLETPITDDTTKAAFTTGLSTAIGSMKGSLDSVLTARASLGGRLNQIEQLGVSSSAVDLQYQSALSEVQDLDYAQALSDYTKTEIMLQAAQKTFSSTTKLSLFDYI